MSALGLAATNQIRCQRRPVASPCRASLRSWGLDMDTLCKCGRSFSSVQARSAHSRLAPDCRQTREEGLAFRREAKRLRDRALGANPRDTRTVERRFWDRVDKSAGCWIWTGYRYPSGYGQFPRAPGDPWRAHRFAWVLTYGDIPDGVFVCHRCDNPPCVRPDHLFLGTADDNSRDMRAKGRGRAGITHVGNRGWSSRNRDLLSGAGNPAAKLSTGQVDQIRARRSAGELLSTLAREFGVSETTISRAGRGKSWSDR